MYVYAREKREGKKAESLSEARERCQPRGQKLVEKKRKEKKVFFLVWFFGFRHLIDFSLSPPKKNKPLPLPTPILFFLI